MPRRCAKNSSSDDSLSEEDVRKRIYRIDIIVAKREGIFAKAGKIFNDCRDKFNKSIKQLVNRYKDQHKDREGAANQEEVEEFIDDTVCRTLLSSNLDATKRVEILDNPYTTSQLKKFVQEAFKIHLRGGSDASLNVKTLDYITMELDIPTQLGIVNEMDVKKLLSCASIKNSRYRRLAS
ncbi:5323_t:CDS:2 [Paraglomus brasilianum]|uniref:5323_t:CDS:1 n=1 Tax=Paraglomus brasilianum TaxID=144538 RepID=A0A9N9AZS1_9GLOM|nr:5323_t:CDS:2 [Paraglomus brasilianum]